VSEQNSPVEQPGGAVPAGSETVGQASAPAEAAGQGPAEEAPKKKKGGVTPFLVSILIIAMAGGVFWFLNREDAMNAKVGDCLGGGDSLETVAADDLKIIACGEANAWYKVVEKVDGKTQIAAGINPGCTNASTEATFWFGKEGEAGSVLCLAKNS
jgi:hypothetical protein